jgi:hypothetical protein
MIALTPIQEDASAELRVSVWQRSRLGVRADDDGCRQLGEEYLELA